MQNRFGYINSKKDSFPLEKFELGSLPVFILLPTEPWGGSPELLQNGIWLMVQNVEKFYLSLFKNTIFMQIVYFSIYNLIKNIPQFHIPDYMGGRKITNEWSVTDPDLYINKIWNFENEISRE